MLLMTVTLPVADNAVCGLQACMPREHTWLWEEHCPCIGLNLVSATAIFSSPPRLQTEELLQPADHLTIVSSLS